MICRICLDATENPLNIFDVDGEQLNIANILQQHFWFKPLPDDIISTVICRQCWFKVYDFHQFYVTIENAHTTLQNQYEKWGKKAEEECSVDQQIAIANRVKEELMDDVMEEIVLTETDNPLYEAEMNLTKDKEDTVSWHSDELAIADKTTDRKLKSVRSTSTIAMKKTRKRKLNALSTDINKRSMPRKDMQNKDDDETTEKPAPRKRIRDWATNKANDEELIKKHIPMGCDLCIYVGENFTQMKEHFKAQHGDIKPYVMCCDRKLNKRFLLVQHACKHEDPEYFKCKDCQKNFSDGYVLRSHIMTCHAPPEMLKYKCDQCERRFSRRFYLELHRPSHIPVNERKFFCDKCPQNRVFASEHLLKIHVNWQHNKAPNICPVCAKEIRDKQSYEKHVRLHLEGSGPRIKCPRPGCESWLKDEDNLKYHLRRHNDEGKIFSCETCGKTCKNRKSLSSHIHFVHSSDVFSCEVCQKKFKRPISLKEHMAQHTGESLYNCPFCTRTFNSNANMHSHKKKMHPIEWALNKRNEYEKKSTQCS